MNCRNSTRIPTGPLIAVLLIFAAVSCRSAQDTEPKTVAPAPSTRPTIVRDYSDPRATVRTMLRAIKANDTDAFLSCFTFSDARVKVWPRVGVRRDMVAHRFVTAVLARWGAGAFGRGDHKLDDGLLAVSDENLDRLMKVADQSSIEREDAEHAKLYYFKSDPALREATWHGPITELEFYHAFRKVGHDWKCETWADSEPPTADASAQSDRVLREMSWWNDAIERLAEDIERGRFKSAADVKKALDELNEAARQRGEVR